MTVTLYVNGQSVTMPSVTSVGYATLRVAEAVGLDPLDGPYRMMVDDKVLLDNSELILNYDGGVVMWLERLTRNE